jgi:hypothetical protein
VEGSFGSGVFEVRHEETTVGPRFRTQDALIKRTHVISRFRDGPKMIDDLDGHAEYVSCHWWRHHVIEDSNT